MHIISVSEASAPLLLQYAFQGLPPAAKQMRRLFDGDYFVNITQGVAYDILGGKTASVHRIGCDPDTMLPQQSTLDMVKGGNMEEVSGSGPGMLLSNHHTGPWLLALTGSGAQDPLRPGTLIPDGQFSDERTRVNSDTSTAHGGRHSAKVNLGSTVPVLFPVPTWQLPKGVFRAELSVWLRSSPPGIRVGPGASDRATAEARPVGVDWEQMTWQISANGSIPVHARHTLLQLVMTSPWATGGKVWVDDLTLRCENATAKVPCPASTTK